MEKNAAEIREHALEFLEVLLACTPTAGYLNVLKTAFGKYQPAPPSRPLGSLAEEMVWEDESGIKADPDEELPEGVVRESDPTTEAAEAGKISKGVKHKGQGKVVPSKKSRGELDIEKYNILSADVKIFFPTKKDSHLHLGVDTCLRKRENVASEGTVWRYKCKFALNGAAAGYEVTDEDRDCNYWSQQLAAMSNHLRKVHLGHVLGCRFCDWRGYRGVNWMEHMQKFHASKESDWYVDADVIQPVQFEITEEVDAQAVLQEMLKPASSKK